MTLHTIPPTGFTTLVGFRAGSTTCAGIDGIWSGTGGHRLGQVDPMRCCNVAIILGCYE
jgi:hypothetical protein